MSRLITALVPPVLADTARLLLGRAIRFTGPYASWADARRDSGSYEEAQILEKVAEATRKVVAGEAAYERDGALFDRIEHSFPVLATLLRAALERGGELRVVDFGGSLGSSYRECRPFLGPSLRALGWAVVEQPSFVQEGKAAFATNELSFHASVHEASAGAAPDVLPLSSVLQYLPEPAAALEDMLAINPRYVVVDRTIVNASNQDRLYVQHVPARIYAARYPVWSLSEPRLAHGFAARYELLAQSPSLPFPALRRIDSSFECYVFRRRAGAVP